MRRSVPEPSASEAFARLVRDTRTDDIPLILETPDPGLWPEEIASLLTIAK